MAFRSSTKVQVLLVISVYLCSVNSRATVCPPIQMSSEIQSQFQLLQHASGWIPIHQEQVINQIFQANAEPLVQFQCYTEKGNDPNALADVLAALKMQILRLRFLVFKKDQVGVTKSLQAMRKMSGGFLNQPTLMARRLGASVRSLFLDELERLIDLYPDMVRDEVRLGYWRSDLTNGIETEIMGQWRALKSQIPTSATPTSLARYYGYRSWKAPGVYRSRLSKLLSRFRVETTETLESQLHTLFKLNKNNFDLVDSERSIQHYLAASLGEIRKNNYFLLKPWLEPVIDEKVKSLKSELGVSWSVISPLVGVAVEGSFRELDQPVEILDGVRLNQAKIHFARVKNPLGRLYEIVFLKRMTQMWTQIDVVQLRSDLNRVSFLKTLLAVQDYQKKYSRWPASVDDLVKQRMIQEVPKDYFTGRSLRYDSDHKQIWSVGENGIDEKGKGDDLSLSLSL